MRTRLSGPRDAWPFSQAIETPESTEEETKGGSDSGQRKRKGQDVKCAGHLQI